LGVSCLDLGEGFIFGCVKRIKDLGFVCELGFGGDGKGMKGLWRGKPLFGSFKKIGKGFWGVLKGFICPILKFPQIGGFGGG